MRRAAIALVLVGATLAAHSVGAEPIAIESYGGPRPDDTEGTVARLLAELARRGYLVGGALVARISSESRKREHRTKQCSGAADKLCMRASRTTRHQGRCHA